jgi:uncharacterized protein
MIIRQLGEFAVVKLDPQLPPPSIPSTSDLWNLARTMDELSLVCAVQEIPPSGVQSIERYWAAFRVAGSMDFSLTGVVARISQPLAEAGVPIFVISTFDTDYILTPEKSVNTAIESWRLHGIEVLEPTHQSHRLDFIDLEYEISDIAANDRENKVWLIDYPTTNDILIAQLASESHVPSGMFQIRLRSTGEAIGSIGFKGEQQFDQVIAVEIRYELAPSLQGQGLGTEAVAGIVHEARARGIEHLCAETALANTASQEVLQKNGFEAISRNESSMMWLLKL